ncbi:hypothetical protein [Algoriphagus vanfongensis]|uniref:hypothetical protein n=1 Tax=Algoriphagus vanfongensis TaxID=426371 RepID=UPI0003FCCA8F|nr:hypothetical protein [Algoriphagus vanfongensis]
MVAPICLFVYNRFNNVVSLLDSLKGNYLSNESDLFVFSDGPKSSSDIESIDLIRKYLSNINGFKSVFVIERKNNLGLAKSIISGVSEVISKYGSAIVLEDDLILSNNFLVFMNQALVNYNSNKLVCSISGYRPNFQINESFPFDAFFSHRVTSWGWATWKDRWNKVDWDFKNVYIKDEVNVKLYGDDLKSLISKQLNEDIDSWAIRWFYFHLLNNLYAIVPKISKVRNVGFGDCATHTKLQSSFFDSILDLSENTFFLFPSAFDIDNKVLSRKHINHYSYMNKIYHRCISMISRVIKYK